VKGQDIQPNFRLAKENTYSELIRKYDSKVVNPYWLDNKSFIYVTRHVERKYVLTSFNCLNSEKTKLDLEFAELDRSTYKFEFRGKEYLYDTYTGNIKEAPTEIEKSISNNELSVFVKSHNLFIRNNISNETKQLSFDGETYFSFKSSIDYNYTNENLDCDTLTKQANITWSPNNSFFLAFRSDARKIPDSWTINSIALPRPSLTTYKQRNPGDTFPKDEIWVYDTKKKSFTKTNLKKWENENYWFIGWSSYCDGCFIQRINREQNKCDILLLHKNGEFEVIIEERPNANIYFQQEFREVGKNKYLWLSRRDGWAHLYLYNTKEKTIDQFTQGSFTVESIIGIDSSSHRLYFSAFGKEKKINPYYRYYYSLNLKNKEIKLLTPENGNHQIQFSPDFRYFVDVYSKVDLPHKSQLRDFEGNLIFDLEKAEASLLFDNGWKNPEIFNVKATDLITDLWGVMWKPFDFDPHKKYPIITFVYPGPQENFVPVNFFERLNNVHLAQYGFIVVMCDTRGSSYKRSKEFSEYYRTNLRDYPLSDNKYMIEQLINKHSFIDKDKIGIWGGSSGGFMAASAILKHPDFYKVSVARAGQHEPAIFHSWWSDIFNTPIGKAESDTLYSNISLAKNLKGKLFIIHGESDMNVHPANSARLVDELMRQGKYFDYLVIPNCGHGWGQNGLYVQKRIWLYFIENLMDYKIHDMNIMK
jgi:dipeptidyl aminopeptidase/acylaminoacyl peptidase